jgi:hypothetical protein
MVLGRFSDIHAVDAPSAAVTTSSFAGDLSNPGPMTGAVSVVGGAPSATYKAAMTFRALPDADGGSSRSYIGRYVISLSCSTGVGSNGTEMVRQESRFRDGMASSGDAPLITTDSAGRADCDYRASFSGSAPPGNTTAIRAEIWLSSAETVLTQTAGPAVTPASMAIPEAPFPILLPISGLLVLGFLGLYRHTRGRHEQGAQLSE